MSRLNGRKKRDQTKTGSPQKYEQIICNLCLFSVKRAVISTHKKSKHHLEIAERLKKIKDTKIEELTENMRNQIAINEENNSKK